MRNRLFGTRRRKVVAALVAVLAIPATALAAWAVFTGVNGSSEGTFQAATNNTAFTVTLKTPIPVLAP